MSEFQPKQERSAHTRAEILAAAQTAFARSGYESATVAEICELAGISKGAFYHHYPSKQSIYLELLHDWLADFDRGLLALRASAENVPALLRAMSASFPAIFQVAEGQLPILLDFWVQAARDPAMWEATIAPFARYYALITDLVQDGISEGSLQAVEARQTALILVSMGVGALLQGLLAEDSAQWGTVGQDGIELILHSIERKPEER
jgi:AcrR family transcriptional regulator